MATKKNHGLVLITGASAGIGRELALEFGARAETLVLVARRLDRLERLREELLRRHAELNVVALAADLSDEHEIESLLARVSERAGAVDVLVNNAGLGDSVLFDRSEWARTRQVLRTNVFAVAQLTSALVPGMVKRRRGGVLNIGSGAGLTVLPNAATYVGSKHFVAGFSEALRADLSGTGVTVTQVCPGPVASEFDEVAGSPGGMIGTQRSPDHCRAVRARSGGRLRARKGASFPRLGLSVSDENAAPASVVDATPASRDAGRPGASWTDAQRIKPGSIPVGA